MRCIVGWNYSKKLRVFPKGLAVVKRSARLVAAVAATEEAIAQLFGWGAKKRETVASGNGVLILSQHWLCLYAAKWTSRGQPSVLFSTASSCTGPSRGRATTSALRSVAASTWPAPKTGSSRCSDGQTVTNPPDWNATFSQSEYSRKVCPWLSSYGVESLLGQSPT